MRIRLDLANFDVNENAEYISEALKDKELLGLARGQRAIAPTFEQVVDDITFTPGAFYMIYSDSIDEEEKNKLIGWARLVPVDRWEANLGIVIADPAYRNKGVGYDVCKALLLHAFPIFQMVSWWTVDYNEASIMLANKLGFHLKEVIPHYKDGVKEFNGLKFIKGRLDDYIKTKKNQEETSQES